MSKFGPTAVVASAMLAGCAGTINPANTAGSSQQLRFAGATFYCSHKLPEGAQLATECVYEDKLDEAYKELALLHALYKGYEQSKQ